MVFSNGKMEVNIQGSIKRGKNMEAEYTKKLTEMYLKDFSKTMFFKEMEFTNIQMEIHMSVITKMGTEEVKVCSSGQTEISMMDSGIEA
jgi:hypothetical protein